MKAILTAFLIFALFPADSWAKSYGSSYRNGGRNSYVRKSRNNSNSRYSHRSNPPPKTSIKKSTQTKSTKASLIQKSSSRDQASFLTMWIAFQFGQSGANLFYPVGNGSHHWLLHSALFHRKVTSSSYVPATPLSAEEINSSEAMAEQRSLLQFEIFQEMKNSWAMILAAAPKFGEEFGTRAVAIRELIASFEQRMAEHNDADSTPDELEEEAQSIEKTIADLEADLDLLVMRDPAVEPEWAHRNDKVIAAMEKFEALSVITNPDDKTTDSERSCSVYANKVLLGSFTRVLRRNAFDIRFMKDGREFAKESINAMEKARFFGLSAKAMKNKKYYGTIDVSSEDSRVYKVFEDINWYLDSKIIELEISGPICESIFPSMLHYMPEDYRNDAIFGMMQLNGLIDLGQD